MVEVAFTVVVEVVLAAALLRLTSSKRFWSMTQYDWTVYLDMTLCRNNGLKIEEHVMDGSDEYIDSRLVLKGRK